MLAASGIGGGKHFARLAIAAGGEQAGEPGAGQNGIGEENQPLAGPARQQDIAHPRHRDRDRALDGAMSVC